MKKTGKYLVVCMLLTIAILGLFSEPKEDASIIEFLLVFTTTKIVGLLAALVAYKLAGKEFKNFVEAADHD